MQNRRGRCPLIELQESTKERLPTWANIHLVHGTLQLGKLWRTILPPGTTKPFLFGENILYLLQALPPTLPLLKKMTFSLVACAYIVYISRRFLEQRLNPTAKKIIGDERDDSQPNRINVPASKANERLRKKERQKREKGPYSRVQKYVCGHVYVPRNTTVRIVIIV